MNKNKTARLLGAVGALALLLTAGAGPAYAQETAAGIVVEQARLTDSQGLEGESRVTVEGADCIQAQLGTLTMPGAYGTIAVTLQNRNSFPVKLVQKDIDDTTLEGVYVRVALLVPGEETIPAGGRCTFGLTVEWAPDSQQSHEQAEGHFAVRLRYEDGTVWVDPQPDQPTDPDRPNDPADNEGSTGGESGSGAEAAAAGSTSSTPARSAPATGDRAALLPWMALLAASSLGLAGMGHREYHHRKGN